jgi:hypothetical protein
MAKKASVKITGIGDARNSILKFLNDQAKGKDILNELGQVTADQIRNRTRARLEEYKQPELQPSTVDRRKQLISYGNAFSSKVVTPKKSNLSLSGQLLESIKYKIDTAKAIVEIYISPARLPYAGKRKPLLDNSKDNLEIKKDLEKLGRNFFFISDKLKAQLEARIAAALRRKLSIYRSLRSKLNR